MQLSGQGRSLDLLEAQACMLSTLEARKSGPMVNPGKSGGWLAVLSLDSPITTPNPSSRVTLLDWSLLSSGDLLIIMAQIIIAIQMVLEEKFVYKHNIHPLQAVGIEGACGHRPGSSGWRAVSWDSVCCETHRSGIQSGLGT